MSPHTRRNKRTETESRIFWIWPFAIMAWFFSQFLNILYTWAVDMKTSNPEIKIFENYLLYNKYFY